MKICYFSNFVEIKARWFFLEIKSKMPLGVRWIYIFIFNLYFIIMFSKYKNISNASFNI